MRLCATLVSTLLSTLVLSAVGAFADPVESLLSASPFTSKPLYNGDYYTIGLTLEGCELVKTTSTFDKSGVQEKQVAITMDLSKIDPARVETSGADVNLWALEGEVVHCADILGESCIVAERPGESIPMPKGLDLLAGREHAKAVKAVVESCQ